MTLKLKYLTDTVIPMLRKEHKDGEALKKAIHAFLKQGEEEEIPVVNEAGEPVEIEEIILVGAEPAGGGDEPPEQDPAMMSLATIRAEVEKAVTASIKSLSPEPKAKIHGPDSGLDRPHWKSWKVPGKDRRYTRTLKCFKGDGAEERAFGFGQFAVYVISKGQDHDARSWLDDHGFLDNKGRIRKAMNEGSNIAGGAFVPQEFIPDLIRLVEQFGVIRRFSRVWPMQRDTALAPRRTSGLTAYAVGESASITTSDIGTDNVELVARKWATLTRISNELMEDSIIALGDLVGTEIAQAFADKEDDSGFNGDGTSTYHGIFGLTVKIDDGNHTAGIFQAASGNTAYSTLDMADFEQCAGILPDYANPNAAWYISRPGFWASMGRLMLAQGGVTREETESGPQMMFLGYPVRIAQKMNSTLTAQTDTIVALFGDLTLAATFGDRKSMEVASSSDRYFDQDETAIRGIERMDFNAHDLGDTTDAGPIVALKTAS